MEALENSEQTGKRALDAERDSGPFRRIGNSLSGMLRRNKLRVIGGIALAAVVGTSSFLLKHEFDKREAQKSNQLAETRLHDYGFPFGSDDNPYGKIDVEGGAKQIDVRCGAKPDDVVGFGLEDKAPDKIFLTLSAPTDRHGNSVSVDNLQRIPVGSPKLAHTFLTETLPAMCAGVEHAMQPPSH